MATRQARQYSYFVLLPLLGDPQEKGFQIWQN